jgi:ATP-dependent DNA helicase RecG
VVAAIAAYSAIVHSLRTVIMVPTEILAQQHAATLEKLFAHTNVSVRLLTAHTKDKADAAQGDIIVGTHAVIQQKIQFEQLGLVVVDEQHRFGVRQRQALKAHGKNPDGTIPHLLSMTATPIPRTLALAMYGELDVSIIDQLPKGRLPVQTHVVPPEKRAKAYAFIREHVKKGEQVFVLCPLIEPSDLSGSRSVTAEYERLRTEVFPDLRIGMLHGKMKADQKTEIMIQMQNKQIDILVSTSVIEVGVDIPNATIMMIEGAERFGLSQLHQFRGRVGRSSLQSYCFLFSGVDSPQVLQRLRVVEKTSNGFTLAEKDLELRGSGEVYGTQQSGFTQAILALQNPQFIGNAQAAARETIAQGWLQLYPQLKKRLEAFTRTIHLE